MVTVHRASTWRISVYGREHGAPHFHVEGREWRCSVLISGLEVIVGHAPRKELAAAIAWAAEHRTELAALWRELNP